MHLGAVDPPSLGPLVDYAYTSKIEIHEDNVQSLLTAANLLQMSDVKDFCCEFLQSQLHPTNCLGIKDFADTHGCGDLLAQAKSYVESHCAEVLDASDEFLQLQCEKVVDLISSDTITVPSEEKVYEAVIRWVQHEQVSQSGLF